MKIDELAKQLVEQHSLHFFYGEEKFAATCIREGLKMAMRICFDLDKRSSNDCLCYGCAADAIEDLLDGKVELPEVGEDE